MSIQESDGISRRRVAGMGGGFGAHMAFHVRIPARDGVAFAKEVGAERGQCQISMRVGVELSRTGVWGWAGETEFKIK